MGWRAAILFALLVLATATATADEVPRYNRDVRPILAENCFKCHGPDENERKAELRLDVEESARRVLDFGSASFSDSPAPELVRRILADDPTDRMPPSASNKTLTPEQRETLAAWVENGARYEPHWAFVPPEHPALPDVDRSDWPVNGIDNFVLHRLEAEGLEPAPPADRATLLRRVTLDLTGLPPTPDEVDAFVSDSDPHAYEKVVDRLLAPPRYGEHMAIDWLDAARYADTDGYQNDRFRYMHVWRDWVVDAMNRNLPYDDFVVQQLAGDMFPDATLREQIATGFNRNHRINSEAGSLPEEWHVENVADRVDTFGTVFLGLTMGCARCHDHKYDPIAQEEYYRLFAQFNNVPEWGLGPNNGNSPPFIKVPKNWPDISPEQDRLIEPEPYTLSMSQGAVVRPNPGDDTTVMVMEEMAEPRQTHVLVRGRYDAPDPDRPVAAGVPEVFLAEGEAPPKNRLELAEWLVKPDHPLTARVTVNRYWQHFFGTGLVATSENFGIQGEFPSHPELLDWLATEFIAMDWDVKAFHKLIVTSATYRQSAVAAPDALDRDPGNRLLARAPRPRLSGQQLQDQALFVSGLLVEKIGGPPVKPYMPPGLWESISNAKYDQGTGEDLYRRSLYTYWRRTTPPPTMLTFNAAERETCIVRKEKTNTPLQALTLMNNVVFVESARFLAERMLEDGKTLDEQLTAGFMRVMARNPDTEELRQLRDAFSSFRTQFANNPDGALALLDVGEKPRNPDLDRDTLAAMTLAASALLNLDEAIVRN